MLEEKTISQRLEDMTQQNDPLDTLWPENCEGSRRALVIFVGPSPGGKKEVARRPINSDSIKPLWNEPYTAPLSWSSGFKTSFKPIVEAIIQRPYKDAAKLIARVNMDWMGNPESRDVSHRYMWEGCTYVLPVLYECNPDLIIPMDEKTFGILQIALYNDGCEITPVRIGSIKVEISAKSGKVKYHRRLMAFIAKKEGKEFLVIKLLQHPARIYDVVYAERVGQSIRNSVELVRKNKVINLNL